MTFQAIEAAGNKIVYMKLNDQELLTVRAIRQGWFAAGDIMKKEAIKQIMHKPKSGRTYLIRRGRKMSRHTASAAGETAANISGVYKKSIGFKVNGWEEMEFGSESGRGADKYADLLEMGTAKMAPRPMIQNVYNATKGTVISVFQQTIRGFISK